MKNNQHIGIVLTAFTGVALLSLPARGNYSARAFAQKTTFVQAATFAPKPPKTPREKEIYQIYRQSLEADRLFAQRKYAEAIPIYEKSIAALENSEMRRSRSEAAYLWPVGAGELATAFKYGDKEYARAQTGGMDALRYISLMRKMLETACQITGRKTDTADVFLPSDERLVSDAYRAVAETRLPVPDNEWSAVTAKLELATARIEGVLARQPDWKNSEIDHSSYPNLTGSQALAEANRKLAQARAETAQAGKMQNGLPELAQHDLDMAIEDINKMIAQTQAGEFMVARNADEMVGDREEYLKKMTRLIGADYQQAGKGEMPAGALKPLIVKLDALKAAVDARAPLNSFPPNVSHDAALEASLRRQVAQNDPQAKVLKTAMLDSTWEITKNDLGVPLYRRKSGYLLYKLPQEKWARLYIVTYKEDYAGGGSYTNADGADTYGFVRWQKAP